MRIKTLIIAALGVAFGWTAMAQPAQVRMLNGWQAEDGRLMAAFEITLQPGWKTYWRAPGDGGIPPRFDWQGSRNLKSVDVHWPLPEVEETDGLRSVVYYDRVVLPVELTPRGTGRISAKGGIEIGVCSDVCVPMAFDFEMPAQPSQVAATQIRDALRAVPDVTDGHRVAGLGCRFDPLADGMAVTANVPPGDFRAEAAIFEYADKAVWISGAKIQRSGGGLSVTADMVPAAAAPFAVDRSQLTLTLIGGGQGLEIRGCPAG